jgi:putative PIN family toxin of toxin-antitoxin system
VRVTLDTNIVISALLFSGRASPVHAAWIDGKITPQFSGAILEEYQRVLAYPKFKLSPEDVRYLMDEEIILFGVFHDPVQVKDPWIPEAPSDDKFINLAIEAQADFLVSGDAHILDHCAELPCRVFGLNEILSRLGD